MYETKAKNTVFFNLVVIVIFLFIIVLPVSALDDTSDISLGENISEFNEASSLNSTQLLANGVYRIINWGSLNNLTVQNYGISNNTNVHCMENQRESNLFVTEKNQLWLLTHLSNDTYTIRPIHKPNMALDYNNPNVSIYGIGVDYTFSLESTKWKITESLEDELYVIQNTALSSRTLAEDFSTGNVYTKTYTGNDYELWMLIPLSSSEVSSLEGIMVFGNSFVQAGSSTQLVAGVFSESTLNQSVTYNCLDIDISVSTSGIVTGVYEGMANIGVVSDYDSSISGSIKIAVTASSGKTASLIGIPSELGGTHDHTSKYNYTASVLRSIYGTMNSNSTPVYTSILDGETAVMYMMSSEVFIYRGHGNIDSIVFGDGVLSQEMTASAFGVNQSRNLSNVDLVLYCCCWCGAGGRTGDNLVVDTYLKGAENVIGFQVAVICSEANDWLEDFISELSIRCNSNKITCEDVHNALNAISYDYSNTTVSNYNTTYMYND